MTRHENETRAIDTILAASRRLLARSQAKAKDWGGGVWRTTDDGEKIFIKDGEARGGGPAGPVLGGKKPKPTRKPRKKPVAAKPAVAKPVTKPSAATQVEADAAVAGGTLKPKKGESQKVESKKKPAPKKTNRDPNVEKWAQSRFKDEGKARNFAEWFGESKAVDEDGKPKMLFHGTAEFEGKIFERSKLGTTTGAEAAKLGFWFSDDTGVANEYASIAGIKEATNLEMQAEESFQAGDKERAKRLMRMADRIHMAPAGRGESTVPVYLSMQNPMIRDAEKVRDIGLVELAEEAKQGGHDGLIINGLVDAGSYETPATHYLVFNSEEIKSAHGNRGSFSRKEKDITKSLYDMVGWEGSLSKSKTGGVWRTTDDGNKIFIDGAGEVRAGGPGGPVIAGKPVAKKRINKPKPAPGSDSKPSSPKKKIGIVDRKGEPAVVLEGAGYKGMNEDADKWSKKLTREESDAVADWTDGGYERIRKEFATGKAGDVAKGLESALNKGGDYKGDAYRGIAFGNRGIVGFMEKMEAIGVGGIWQDLAPASATVSTQVAYEYSTKATHQVLFRMKTTSGTYVENITQNEDEYEVITKPGAKFKITNLAKNQVVSLDGMLEFTPALYIEMEEIE